MIRARQWVVALCAMALGAALSPAADGPPFTSVRLLSDVDVVAPGATFHAGVELSMEEGWHTYWVNPGDAGAPTEIAWDLPAGITAGPILWPVPYKFEEAGDITTYGYKGTVILLIPMMADRNLKPGQSLELRGDVSWLECSDVCVPGSQTVSLTLPVGLQDRPANEEAFASARLRLPAAPEKFPGLAVSSRLFSRGVTLSVIRPRDPASSSFLTPEFYPLPGDHLRVGRILVRDSGFVTEIRVPLAKANGHEGSLELGGVLVVEPAEVHRGAVALSVTLPAEYVAALPVGSPPDSAGSDDLFDIPGIPAPRVPDWIAVPAGFVGCLLLMIRFLRSAVGRTNPLGIPTWVRMPPPAIPMDRAQFALRSRAGLQTLRRSIRHSQPR